MDHSNPFDYINLASGGGGGVFKFKQMDMMALFINAMQNVFFWQNFLFGETLFGVLH